MERLSLDEIPDWQNFQQLVCGYFHAVKQDKEFNVDDVEVAVTGDGSDGGRDILVTLNVNDSINTFKRIWVVQCKFHNANISKSDLNDYNIPSLLHEYGAHGYLLVCRNSVTSPVSRMFEGLKANCPYKRSYAFWTGDDLLQRVRLKNNLIDHFFPKHSMFLKQQKVKAEEILKENQ